ncbi:hypothetical protein E2C01_072078 [Portunus trituberculatus]|uniref:Uncharacterized protein n=1 Tax=Portunus trituberculatus TaxID=210409 RepID=A0A5B7HYZ2_PORTR|nr:hypothetical protein [Portunus trituberculatus]
MIEEVQRYKIGQHYEQKVKRNVKNVGSISKTAKNTSPQGESIDLRSVVSTNRIIQGMNLCR